MTMKKLALALGLFLTFLFIISAADNTKDTDYDKYWPQWRGPYMTGVSPNGNPPSEWSENKNVKWKIQVPGKGHATPIIWGDRMFILSAVAIGKEDSPTKPAETPQRRRGMPVTRTTKIHKFIIFAINRSDGKILWQHTVKEEVPQEGTHEQGSWASNSPVTDGDFVYAYFGSRGLFCFDMQGNLKWERDFGQMNKRMNFGEGSSPVLYKDKIIVNWDHEGDSFIIALDKKTGKDIWKVDRDEHTSWATPLVIEHDGKAQVITSATQMVRSYDVATGKLVWECSGMTQNAIPVPMEASGIVYLTTGFRGNALLAIRLSEAQGNITDSDAIVWRYDGKDTPYAPSGLLYNDRLYLLRSNNGILSCFDAKTGKQIYGGQRMEGMGNIFASPVAAQDRIYIIGQKGMTFVIKAGPAFEVLAKNQLDDNFNASPAVVGNVMYLRGCKNLYCIAEE
jgi:outer membrane protein assembly factor BamB